MRNIAKGLATVLIIAATLGLIFIRCTSECEREAELKRLIQEKQQLDDCPDRPGCIDTTE
jgi:hypothetical protein